MIKMGSGDWLKNIINLNKARKQKTKKTKDFFVPETDGIILQSQTLEKPTNTVNGVAGHHGVRMLAEVKAAIRIQTAFRAFKARKDFCNMKRILKLQLLMEGDFGKKQTLNMLSNLQSWSRIQTQIRTCRLTTVEDSGIKPKKLESQLRLNVKVHDLEVEWSSNSHTMVEALARIKQREEATVKRERAMAYAFSHQWKANSNASLLPSDSEVASSSWGWSWMERWISARSWESRALVVSTPKKVNSPPGKKSPSMKKSNSLKTSPKGNKTSTNRRLSYGSTTKAEDAKTKPGKIVTK